MVSRYGRVLEPEELQRAARSDPGAFAPKLRRADGGPWRCPCDAGSPAAATTRRAWICAEGKSHVAPGRSRAISRPSTRPDSASRLTDLRTLLRDGLASLAPETRTEITTFLARTLADPAVLISSSDSGAHMQMLCASGDTTLLLTRHVRERGDFTRGLVFGVVELGEAVRNLPSRDEELATRRFA